MKIIEKNWLILLDKKNAYYHVNLSLNRWYHVIHNKFEYFENYIYYAIIGILVIFCIVEASPLIVPQLPQNYVAGDENFTIHYTVKNMDSGIGSLMLETERLQFNYTIQNYYPENITFDYIAMVYHVGQNQYSTFLNDVKIPTNGKFEFTDTIPLEKSGLNTINSTFTINKQVKQLVMQQPYPYIQFIKKISLPLYVQKVYSQSEYDARVALGVTFVLVLATIFYAIQTKKTVTVLKETREAEFLPYIVPTIVPLGPVAVVLQIVNIGKGAARELEIKFRTKEIENNEKIWHHSLFKAGQSQVLYLKDENDKSAFNMEYFENNQTTLLVEATYKDIFNKPHTNTTVIDVTKFVKQFKVVSVQYKEETSDKITNSLKQMAEALGSSKNDVKDLKDIMSSQIDMNRLDFQMSILNKKIDAMLIDESTKKKIKPLVDDLAIIMREEHITLERERLVSILSEIYNINKDTLKIIRNTLLNLRYWVKFSEEGKPF